MQKKCLLFLVLLLCLSSIYRTALCQTQSTASEEFSLLSTNSRALEKEFDFNITQSLNNVTQNITLDKTGIILHLIPSSIKIKNNTKLKVIADDGSSAEMFTFTDGTPFALIDPQKTYSIIQETIPDCNLLKNKFALNDENTICPDSVSYKLHNNLMLSSDTNFIVTLNTKQEFYNIPLIFPAGMEPVKNEQKFIHVLNTKDEVIQTLSGNDTINIAEILKKGELCLISSLTTSAEQEKCLFNKDTSVINQYKNNSLTEGGINFIATFPPNVFKTSKHEFIFNLNDLLETGTEAIKIDKDTSKKLFLEDYNYNLTLNLGKIDKAKNIIRKNTFTLKDPFEITSLLKRVTITIPTKNLEEIIDLFLGQNSTSVLTNILIDSNNTNISIPNNVVVENLIDATPSPTPLPTPLATTAGSQISRLNQVITTPEESEENLVIETYLPNDIKDLTLGKTYTLIEQNIAPKDTGTGTAAQTINNKSKIDYTFLNDLNNLDININGSEIQFNPRKATTLLQNAIFNNKINLTGFLIPPDLRPVVENGYRATIELNMIVELENKDSVSITYSDLKTRDENQLTNFFEFDFVPLGLYKATVKFDSDRKKLFKNAGLIK